VTPNSAIRVEIYDQSYSLRGPDPEYLRKLAEYVDGKMRAVAEQTATVDSLRLAVLAALNIADEYQMLRRRFDRLSGALDEVLVEGKARAEAEARRAV
jgi:cell division protein ZapA